ncbi:hypothetical protein [Ascidiimonas sp. W6]|uniref:hypothetical protein n=1 Tax=Ascidiimonas meishanensis TaxID=3128903 RepID=UPI0030EDC3C8
MKSETASAKEFRETPIKKWVITDSDGTIFPHVNLKNKDKATPPKEFLEQMKQYSIDNPDTGIMVLSGRMSGELNNFYRGAMGPDEEGRTPKIVLASENGAFMQFKPISENAENLSHHEDVIAVAQPISDELKNAMEQIMVAAAGDHYTSNTSDSSENIWVKSELKTYGVTAHLQMPANEADMPEFEAIKEQIAEGFQALGEEQGLLVHLDAAAALTIELVSKGLTMQNIANESPGLKQIFEDNGLTTEKPTQMSYSGDDVGDMTAMNVLNEKFNSGELQGYTSRPSNYTPYDPEDRNPNNPLDARVQDSFFIVGSEEVLPQDQHRSYFLDTTAFEKLNEIRQALSDRQLLPSQSGDTETPPIVLLTSGDILIQQPERYPEGALDNLKDWDQGKVILMAEDTGMEAMKIKELPKKNANIVVATPQGAFYAQAQPTQTAGEEQLTTGSRQYLDLSSNLRSAKVANEIITANPERNEQFELLRNIQTVLVDQGFVQDIEKEAKKEASRSLMETVAAVDIFGIMPVVPTQEATQTPAIIGLQALAARPIAAITAAESKRLTDRRARTEKKGKEKSGPKIG